MSGIVNLAINAPGTEQSENVSIVQSDHSTSVSLKSVIDPTRNLVHNSDASLGSFLSRPLRVATFQWTVGSSINVSLNPWSLYMNQVNALDRMKNYFLFRGRLRLRIMVNGGPFFYGKILVSYSPTDSFSDLASINSTSALDLIPASQLPHLYLDPTTSSEEISIYLSSTIWSILPCILIYQLFLGDCVL